MRLSISKQKVNSGGSGKSSEEYNTQCAASFTKVRLSFASSVHTTEIFLNSSWLQSSHIATSMSNALSQCWLDPATPLQANRQ